MQENIQQPPTPTPAFDLNALLTAALAQVINQATAPLLARIEVLEEKVKYVENHAAAADNTFTLASRIAVLEEVVKHVADEDRIKEIADEVARDVLSEHVDEYDHDSYDRLEDKIEDKIDDYDFDDKIKDVLTNNLTLTVRVE